MTKDQEIIGGLLGPNAGIEDCLDTLHPLVGFTGVARAGKDTAAEILIRLGYTSSSHGNILKRRMNAQTLWEAVQLWAWAAFVRKAGIPEMLRLTPALLVFHLLCIDATTEGRTKEWIRPALEYFGARWEKEILDELFSTLPLPALNVRIYNGKQAAAWVKEGGIIFEITRPGAEVESEFFARQLQEIRDGGYLSATITNDSTKEQLWDRVLSAAVIEGV